MKHDVCNTFKWDLSHRVYTRVNVFPAGALLLLCSLLQGCASEQVLTSGPVLSSHLQRLNVEFDPNFGSQQKGSNSDLLAARLQGVPSPSSEPAGSNADAPLAGWLGMGRFGRESSVYFMQQFPKLMAAHGVKVVAHEQGVPLLYVYMKSFRTVLHGGTNTEVDLAGTLTDPEGKKTWTFDTTLGVEGMRTEYFDHFLENLVAAMGRDGLIAGSGS